jgi:hypothetical protein
LAIVGAFFLLVYFPLRGKSNSKTQKLKNSKNSKAQKLKSSKDTMTTVAYPVNILPRICRKRKDVDEFDILIKQAKTLSLSSPFPTLPSTRTVETSMPETTVPPATPIKIVPPATPIITRTVETTVPPATQTTETTSVDVSTQVFGSPLEIITQLGRMVAKIEHLTCELSQSRADVRRIQKTLDGLLVARPVPHDQYHS